LTHKATITISSEGPSPSVHVELDWSPELDKFDPRELGYTPAAFQFLEAHILPILERAMIMGSGILDDSPSRYDN
jgi:hypothetical protein